MALALRAETDQTGGAEGVWCKAVRPSKCFPGLILPLPSDWLFPTYMWSRL